MNDKKSLLTNMVSISLIGLGYILPQHGEIVKMVGFFAFSGAITNWLAIYMLFERIPFLYGSGIIPLQFEVFKINIKKMIMEQFFSEINVARFFNAQAILGDTDRFVANITESINYEKMYEGLVEEILNTSIGGMVNMFGGGKVLSSLKEPCVQKFKVMIQDIATSTLLPNLFDSKLSDTLHSKIEKMVDARLNELMPEQVKDLVHDMIGKYLGWVVIWGGVFGGAIGFLMEIIFKLK